MLRLVSAALRGSTQKIISTGLVNINRIESNVSAQVRCFTALAKQHVWQENYNADTKSTSLLSNSLSKLLVPKVQTPTVPCRTVIKYSLRKGKRKSVKTVLKRFYRLHWGIWIRTIAGRHKHLWKKTPRRRLRAKHHVFTTAKQSWMLDKMVTKYWRRPKFYVDDIYEPYHTREEFVYTRKKPLPLPEQ